MSRLPKTISVEKLDNSVLFTFAQNQHYLYDGTIEVPFNSLSIIADKSEAITLRKSASNDIFISAPWENFDINASNKEDVVDALTDMLYDETGGGVSREEVEDMIDAATSGIPSSQTIEQLRNDVNTISGNVQTLSGEVATKADASDLQALSEKVDTKLDASAYTPTDLSEYWTSAETKSYVDDALDDYYDKDYVDAALADKLDASAYTPTDLSEYWTSAETQNAINAATSGIPSSQVIEQLRTDVNTISGNVENNYYDKEYIDEKEEVVASALTQLNLRLNEDEEVTAAALNDLNDRIGSGGGALFVDFDDLMNNMNDDKWDELVNAIQNNKPIFYWYDYSEGDITDAGQSPVDGYIFIDQTEGEESTEISLKQLYGGGYRELYIVKNGSEDYEVTDDGRDYQPLLQAGSGISIDEYNVISVTVDSELDENSNNPVANSAITNVIIDDEEVISRAINELNDRLVAVESGGSSVTVDTSLDSGSTNPVANSAITVALDGKANTSDLTIITNNVETISGAVDGKQDVLSAGTGIEISGNVISVTGGGVTVDSAFSRTSENPVQNKVITNNVTDGNGTVGSTGGKYKWEFYSVGGVSTNQGFYIDTINGQSVIKKYNTTRNLNLVETSAITSAITSASTNTEVAGAKAVYDAIQAGGGGGVTVDSTLDTGSTNPVANSAITTAINAKQDTLHIYTENRNTGTAELHSNDSSIIFNAGGASITANNPSFGINTFNVAGTGVTINNERVLTEGDVTSAITSASTNSEVAGAKAVYDALDGKADASTTYTKNEVNNLVNNKFWCGTQAQYDALATKENDVLYLIHE